MHTHTQKQKGFTLIDILISVAIVSFLSSVFLFNTTEARKKAEDGKMKVESAQVSTALELYKSDNNGVLPLKVTNSGAGGSLHKEGTPEYNTAMQELVDNGYLGSIPESFDGSSYAYGESVDGLEYLFAAQLNIPEGDSGGGDLCEVLEEPEVSGNPTNCVSIPSGPPSVPGSCPAGSYNSCADFMAQNPSKICVEYPTSNFCSIYNQEGAFSNSICNCSGFFCGTNGGRNTWLPVDCPNDLSGIICDAPAEPEDSMCDGSDPTDYCTCN